MDVILASATHELLPRSTAARADRSRTCIAHRLIMRSDVERTEEKLTSVGCGVLFGLPFALVGLLCTAGALRQLIHGDWKQALLGSVYAVVFCGVGFGLIYLSIRPPLRAPTTLEASAPGEPWRSRPDWAAGD